jgi:hypothetical protein
VFIVQGAVLELEDFDFAGFLRWCEFDVALAEREEHRATFVFRVGKKFFVLRGRQQVLDGGVAEGSHGVAGGEEDEAPGEEVSANEEGTGEDEEQNVEHGAEVFV